MQVVKVLHGSDSDIHWLQRDFGIYIANLFDTGQAARTLGLQGFGLAFLLQKYCNVKVGAWYACCITFIIMICALWLTHSHTQL